MRIRKRQPLLVKESPRLALNMSAGNSSEVEYFVGQTCCTCCSQQRQLQYWDHDEDDDGNGDDVLGSNRFSDQDDEPVVIDDKPQASLSKVQTVEFVPGKGLSSRIEFGDHSGKSATKDREDSEQIAAGSEPRVSSTFESLGGPERVRGNEHNIRSPGGRNCSQGDLNYPGNKSTESLLHSLYCVFSKLSGKAVLTAREALSRIIEQRLPGLDEKMGLPSVQVAKVMRSNPYFVHLEGGKFFLCSGPTTEINDEESRIAMDSINPPTSLSSNLEQKVGGLSGISNAGSARAEQELVSSSGVRYKRKRSKSTLSECGTMNTSARKEGVRSVKPQTPAPIKSNDATQISEVRICKRYDGRGWKCNEKALEGYSMCRHHHELIVNRLARLRSTGRLGSKKSVKKRKGSGKQVKEGIINNDADLTVKDFESGPHWWKNVKARSLKSINC